MHAHVFIHTLHVRSLPDAPPVGDVGKSDTLGSTGSARKRGGGAKKAMQANKSALRAPRALCCLTLSNPIRMAALALVEWKYPFLCVLKPPPQVAFLAVPPLTEPSSPLTFSFSSPYSPTAWPWASPSPSPTTTPTPPITNW